MLENARSVIRCDNHFTAHMGTILMMTITSRCSSMDAKIHLILVYIIYPMSVSYLLEAISSRFA